jgi:hypothetical protein
VLCLQDTTQLDLPADDGQSVAATCLVARELDAPMGVKPIEWRLLSNREASTLQEAVELIDWYRVRWEIEMLFNVLKNGCRVEGLQLGAIERLERALALCVRRDAKVDGPFYPRTASKRSA